MKIKLFLFVPIIVFLVSCNKTRFSERANFDFIEITRSNGWTGPSTIFIDSLWVIKRCDYHINNSDTSRCYIDTIDNDLRMIIASKIDSLKFIQIDSIYDGHCQDCGAYIIRLGFDNRIINSEIIGINEFENDIVSFSKFISNIKIIDNPIDSVILFKTTRLFVPPPIFPEIKYLAPPDTFINQ